MPGYALAPVLTPVLRDSVTAGTFGTINERDAGDAAKDALVQRKLGQTGWQRLYEFKTYYTLGWGEGDGQPVSPRALSALYAFLEKLELQPGMIPSIYLLKDGSLGLAWENVAGNEVEVSFRSNEIHVYRGIDDAEMVFKTAQSAELGRMAANLSSGSNAWPRR
jgi:hypothetical protein